MKKNTVNSKKSFAFAMTVFFTVLFTTGRFFAPFAIAETPVAESGRSKALFSIRGMTCGGCVKNIERRLAKFDGISEVNIDLGKKQGEIFFDNKKIDDANKIAEAISGAGYPAKLRETASADPVAEKKKEPAKSAVKISPLPAEQGEAKGKQVAVNSSEYVAAAGKWKITRGELDTEMAIAMTRYKNLKGDDVFNSEQGKKILTQLKRQVINYMLGEAIWLGELEKFGFAVDKSTVEDEFKKVLTREGLDRETFKSKITKDGLSFDYYMKKFERRVRLAKYLEANVYKDDENDEEKRQSYKHWFDSVKSATSINYYDAEVKALMLPVTPSAHSANKK